MYGIVWIVWTPGNPPPPPGLGLGLGSVGLGLGLGFGRGLAGFLPNREKKCQKSNIAAGPGQTWEFFRGFGGVFLNPGSVDGCGVLQ